MEGADSDEAEPLSERLLRVWRSAEFAPEMRQRGKKRLPPAATASKVPPKKADPEAGLFYSPNMGVNPYA